VAEAIERELHATVDEYADNWDLRESTRPSWRWSHIFGDKGFDVGAPLQCSPHSTRACSAPLGAGLGWAGSDVAKVGLPAFHRHCSMPFNLHRRRRKHAHRSILCSHNHSHAARHMFQPPYLRAWEDLSRCFCACWGILPRDSGDGCVRLSAPAEARRISGAGRRAPLSRCIIVREARLRVVCAGRRRFSISVLIATPKRAGY
jgi:hypothetical protein